MDEIQTGLFLGNLGAAQDQSHLRQNGITHILGVIHFEPKYPHGIKTMVVTAEDMAHADLLTHWDKTYEFIDDCLENGGRVLVHCLMGISRSSSTVVAYLMKKYSWSFEKALETVQEKHFMAYPNEGFRMQLALYSKFGCKLDKNNPDFLAYVFKNLPAMSKSFGGIHSNGSLGLKSMPDENLCDRDVFQIFPLKWMPYHEIKGKLACPKCSAKLGHFDWTGKQCPCGKYITPWFHIPESKVDRTQIGSKSQEHSEISEIPSEKELV